MYRVRFAPVAGARGDRSMRSSNDSPARRFMCRSLDAQPKKTQASFCTSYPATTRAGMVDAIPPRSVRTRIGVSLCLTAIPGAASRPRTASAGVCRRCPGSSRMHSSRGPSGSACRARRESLWRAPAPFRAGTLTDMPATEATLTINALTSGAVRRSKAP